MQTRVQTPALAHNQLRATGQTQTGNTQLQRKSHTVRRTKHKRPRRPKTRPLSRSRHPRGPRISTPLPTAL